MRSQASPPGGAAAPRRTLDLGRPGAAEGEAGGRGLYFISVLFLRLSSGQLIPPVQKEEGHCAFEGPFPRVTYRSQFSAALRLGFSPSWTVQVSGRGVRGQG